MQCISCDRRSATTSQWSAVDQLRNQTEQSESSAKRGRERRLCGRGYSVLPSPLAASATLRLGGEGGSSTLRSRLPLRTTPQASAAWPSATAERNALPTHRLHPPCYHMRNAHVFCEDAEAEAARSWELWRRPENSGGLAARWPCNGVCTWLCREGEAWHEP